MTPDLMEEGTRRRERMRQREAEAAARSAWRRLRENNPDIAAPVGCMWL